MNGIIKHLQGEFFSAKQPSLSGALLCYLTQPGQIYVENIMTKNSNQKKNNPQTGQILSACIAHRHAALWSDSRNPPPHQHRDTLWNSANSCWVVLTGPAPCDLDAREPLPPPKWEVTFSEGFDTWEGQILAGNSRQRQASLLPVSN